MDTRHWFWPTGKRTEAFVEAPLEKHEHVVLVPHVLLLWLRSSDLFELASDVLFRSARDGTGEVVGIYGHSIVCWFGYKLVGRLAFRPTAVTDPKSHLQPT